MEIKYLDTNCVIVECKPIVRTIHIEHQFIRLSFPWQVFKFSDLYGINPTLQLFFRQTPLTFEDHRLYAPYLTNVYSNQCVCLGKPMLGGCDQLDIVKRTINYFWNSTFTMDTTGSFNLTNTTYDSLARLTKEDPEFWKSFNFYFAGKLTRPSHKPKINLLWK